MISTGLGNVTVPYTYPQNDVYSRGQSNTVYMPDTGYPVYRTPSANDYENEPGSRWHGRPIQKFTPNGYVMTPVGELGASPDVPPLYLHIDKVAAIGPTIMAAIGAGFGVGLATQRRPLGAVIGALAGGILGVLFTPAR
jgi:hypothetical protein